MKKTFVWVLLLASLSVSAQTAAIRPAFRMKVVEAVQDIDSIDDLENGPVETAMNRVEARRAVQELGRIAQNPVERNIAAQVAQYLLDERVCIYTRESMSVDGSKKCSDNSFATREAALKSAGIDSATVYPHATTK